jgi:hypothetical protein
MRRGTRVVAACGGLALVLGLATFPSDAQEAKSRRKSVAPAKADEARKVAVPPGVRVPNHFNQLDPPLTPEQRERIYEIQARALRDCEAVLTPAQQSSLRRLREQGADEPAAKKSTIKGATPGEGDEPPPTKGTSPRKDSTRKKAG